jgi:hypothetical protein
MQEAATNNVMQLMQQPSYHESQLRAQEQQLEQGFEGMLRHVGCQRYRNAMREYMQVCMSDQKSKSRQDCILPILARYLKAETPQFRLPPETPSEQPKKSNVQFPMATLMLISLKSSPRSCWILLMKMAWRGPDMTPRRSAMVPPL